MQAYRHQRRLGLGCCQLTFTGGRLYVYTFELGKEWTYLSEEIALVYLTTGVYNQRLKEHHETDNPESCRRLRIDPRS